MNDNQDRPALVTIITAVRNGEAYIRDSIESVIRQTYKNIEYFVIDANSTDKTYTIVKEFDSAIQWHVSEPDTGLADGWNKGLRRAKGKYIALLNADDFYDPEFIEKSVLALEASPRSISYGSTVLIDPETGVSRLYEGRFNREKIGKGFGFMHTSCVVPNSIYQEVGGFDESYRIGLDVEFLMRSLNQGVQLEKSQAVNYMRAGGMSRMFVAKARKDHTRALKQHGFYEKFWLEDLVQAYSLRLQCLVGPPRIAKFRSQWRLATLYAFNCIYNLCCSKMLRHVMLTKSGCKIGVNSLIHPKVQFFSVGRISIGENSVICSNCYLDNRYPIKIGNNVMIAHGCKIYTTGHKIDCPYFRGFGRSVTISNRCVLFANATIMPGVTLGEGAVVLPNAVVTKNVEPYTVVGGNPAKLIRHRDKDLRYHIVYDDYFAI